MDRLFEPGGPTKVVSGLPARVPGMSPFDNPDPVMLKSNAWYARSQRNKRFIRRNDERAGCRGSRREMGFARCRALPKRPLTKLTLALGEVVNAFGRTGLKRQAPRPLVGALKPGESQETKTPGQDGVGTHTLAGRSLGDPVNMVCSRGLPMSGNDRSLDISLFSVSYKATSAAKGAR